MRIVKALLVVSIIFSLCACGNAEKPGIKTDASVSPTTELTLPPVPPTSVVEESPEPTLTEEATVRPTMEASGVSFEKIKKILGVDILALLNALDNETMGNNLQYTEISLTACNFSRTDGKKEDYVLQVLYNIFSNNHTRKLVCWYIKENGQFRMVREDRSSFIQNEIKPIDVDGDGQSEFLEYFYEDKYLPRVEIIRYEKNGFQSIFRQVLGYYFFMDPYNFENKMEFVKNKHGGLDISFTIQTSFNEEKLKDLKNSKPDEYNRYMRMKKLPKPVHQKVLYTFEGKMYQPDRKVYDVTQFFSDYILAGMWPDMD